MKLEKITGYKTSDGRVFEHEAPAKLHEEKIKIQNKINKFVDKHYFPNMTRSDLQDMLTDFYNEF